MQTDRKLSASDTRALSYDAGLRRYFQKIYNLMAFGLTLTGLVAYAVSHSPAAMEIFYGNAAVRLAVILSPLAMVFLVFTPARFNTLSSRKLTMLFFTYASLLGISLATIFLVYSNQSVARAFFITAGTFAGVSIIGYTTKRDLTGMAHILYMGFLGVFLASIVSYFMHSAPLQIAISLVSVVVFTGLLAWKTQQLKQMYSHNAGFEANEKLAVWGALQLYISFINLFLAVMRLSGSRR